MFKFSLQPVLAVREAVEETRQRELAQAHKVLEGITTQLAALEDKIVETHQGLTDASGRGASAAKRELYERWLDQARAGREGLARQIELERLEVERRRKVLNEAAKDRMAIEELRELEKREYLEEQNRIEQRWLDEIAIQQVAARRREKQENLTRLEERISP